MYEEVCGISVNGAMFPSLASFEFFRRTSKSTGRVSIVYGKNGSGKSMLSRAFLKCADSEIPELIESELIDFDGNTIELSLQQRVNIFVFNEEYIEKNIRLKQEGLNTIIMFGEQGDLETKIQLAEKVLSESSEEYEKQELECKKYEENTNITSPGYHMSQIKSLLQGDGNWAGRERLIKGKRQNSPVNDRVINEIVILSPEGTEIEVQTEYNKQFLELQKLLDGAERITLKVTQVSSTVDEKKIFALLSEKIEKPVLSERDQCIMEFVLQGQQRHFEDVKSTFSNLMTGMCPYCLQPISDEYKTGLIDSIQKVLSKTVGEHIDKLQKVKIRDVEISLDEYNSLEASQIKKCQNLLQSVKMVIRKYNELIDNKIANTYIPIEAESMELVSFIQALNSELEALEKQRLEYNSKFDQIENIRSKLVELNMKLAYFSVIEHHNQINKLNIEWDKEKENLQTIYETIDSKQTELTILIQQKKSVKIAVDYINRGLQYVFFSKKRLEIKVVGDSYTLLSNEKSVKPSNISCGERNIIALCYFFTEIMSNLNVTAIHTNEVFLVIDDPISSFDLENKVGILSYLKSQLLRVLLGNMNSKVIMMSHDLGSIYDMQKAFNEIKAAANRKFTKNVTDYTLVELNNMSLIDFPYKSRNEYNQLLKLIYDYSSGSGNFDSNDLIIGNVMRRALEAFSTFEYRKGIDEVSCDQDILASMGNQKYSDYFENLMYRLVLNGESHSEERIKSLNDLNFFNTISEVEKMRTAKDVLCLINVLNPQHIDAHFRDMPDSISTINGWCQYILLE